MLEEFGVETPFLDSIRESGMSGDLRSVDTPTTLPAWTSFATGKDPGSHGITTMLTQSRDYEISPVHPNATDAKIYDLIEDAVFVNLPASVGQDPAAADTQLVSSFLAADREDAVPETLQSFNAYDEYIVHDDWSLKSDPEAYVQHLIEATRARYRFALEAFDREDPHVGFVLFSTPDWVGHHLQFAPDDATRQRWYQSVVEACDEYTAALAERATNVLVLSDHGFEHKPKRLHLQTWFEQNGYLHRQNDRTTVQRLATGMAKHIARRFDGVFDGLRRAYLRIVNTDGGELLGDMVDFNPDMDYVTSRAWQLRYGCIYINHDQFDSPTVSEPDALCAELREALAALTDEGKDVFEFVETPENVYVDPDPEGRLPDLIARPASGYLPLRAFSPTGEPIVNAVGQGHYDHRYQGIIAMDGPLFDPETDRVREMSIIDVLPTLLHAIGEPLCPNFDGDCRTDLLRGDATPTVRDATAVPTPNVRDRQEREAVAMEQLRELGYLE